MSWMRSVSAISLAGLLLTCGCVTRLCRYDVRLKADPDLRSANRRYPPVEVHVVVLGAADSEAMALRSMSDYWKPRPVREGYEGQEKRMFFGEERDLEQVFSNEEPLWDAWKKVKEPKLWIVADLPGTYPDRAKDPRRLAIPLERTKWWFRTLHSIDIVLSRDNGVYARTPAADQSKKQ